jgi:hypothetical protein
MQCQHGELQMTILECAHCGQVVFAITLREMHEEELNAD